MLHAFWSDYHRFFHKHGICSLCTGKCNFSPGGALARFCVNSPASPWGACSFSKEKWQMPDKCTGGWARLELTEPLSPLTTLGNYHPWRGLSPLTTLGITWIIKPMPKRKVTCSQYSDYFISYPFSPQTFWSSSLLLAKELWVGSIKSQVESGLL